MTGGQGSSNLLYLYSSAVISLVLLSSRAFGSTFGQSHVIGNKASGLTLLRWLTGRFALNLSAYFT